MVIGTVIDWKQMDNESAKFLRETHWQKNWKAEFRRSDCSRPNSYLWEPNLLQKDQLHNTQGDHALNIKFGCGMSTNKTMGEKKKNLLEDGPWGHEEKRM